MSANLVTATDTAPNGRHGPWSSEKAWAWHNGQPWRRGANYMPASAANRVDQWQSLGAEARFAEMDREMALARECGFNAMRVLILEEGFCVWLDEHDAFMANFERSLEIMAKYEIAAMVVLYTDCSRPKRIWKRPHLGEQEYDVGYHGGRRLTQHGSFPGECGYLMIDEAEYREKFHEMCRELIGKYAHDKRVFAWNLWNEPGAGNRGDMSEPIIRELFELAWEINPDQPLCADTWSRSIRKLANGGEAEGVEKAALELSDIISYHGYCGLETQIKLADVLLAKYNRPLYNTEWLLRGHGCEFTDNYAFFAQRKIGCMNWGFVNGKYQTHEPYEPCWRSRFDYAPGADPTRWFHDLFRPSLHPWDPYEIACARNINAQSDDDVAGTSLRAKVRKYCKVTDENMWYGYRRICFEFEGRNAWIVEPSAKPIDGMPWTWTMQWAEAFVDRTGVLDLLRRGYHHVTIDLFETRMDENGLAVAADFQKFLLEKLGFAQKANLVGMSWGGFFSIRYAAANPMNVAKIYLDAPLLNFDGFGSVDPERIGVWLKAKPSDGVWTTDPRMPLNKAEAIAAAGIPVLLLYGGQDTLVPPHFNCEPFVERFKAAGGAIEVNNRGLFGHHPHGLDPDKTAQITHFFIG